MHHVDSLQQVQSLYLVLLPKLKPIKDTETAPVLPQVIRSPSTGVRIMLEYKEQYIFVKRILRHLAP